MLKQIVLPVLLTTLLVGAGSVQARDNFAAPSDKARREARTGVSLDQAVQQVRAQTGGRVLSAETISQGGRPVHRIKVLLPSGHVQIVHVDADRR